MAKFNPDVQEPNPQDYLRASHGISVPENIKPRGQEPNTILPHGQTVGDLSGAIGKKGLGELIGDSTKLAAEAAGYGDKIVRNVIDEKVHEVEAIRDRFTKQLEDMGGNVVGGLGGTDIGGSYDDTLTGAYAQATPDEYPNEVKNVGRTAETLQTAFDQNKLSQTQYYGALNSKLKSLRAQFPGYRDYIDREVSRVVGTNPANAYIRSQIMDLNRAMAGKGDEVKATMTEVRSLIKDGWHGPGGLLASDMLKMLRNNPTPETLDWVQKQINIHNARKYDLTVSAQERSEREGQERDEKSEASVDGQKMVFGVIDETVEKAKLKYGVQLPGNFAKVSQAALEGKIPPELVRSFAADLAQERGIVFNAAIARLANTVDPITKKTYIDKLGGMDAAKKFVNDNLFNYDFMLKLATDGDFGLIPKIANANKDAIEVTTSGMLNDPRTRNVTRNLAAARTVFPNITVDMMQKLLPSAQWQSLETYFLGQTAAMVTQPQLRPGGSGRPDTVMDTIEDMKRKGIATPQNNNELISFAEKIGDKSIDDGWKKNMIKGTFSNLTYGLIDEFQKEGVDPATGKPTRFGQYSIFRRLTSDDITSEVKRLDAQEPGLWQKYSDWVKYSFGVSMYSNEIKDLNQPMPEGISIQWNKEQHKWGMTVGKDTDALYKSSFTPQPGMRNYDPARVEFIKRSLRNLNSALQGVSKVAETEGSDVNSYLINLMQTFGARISDEGVPAAMQQAIKKSREEQEKIRSKYKE